MVAKKLTAYISDLKVKNTKSGQIINDFAHETDETVQATRLRMIHKYNHTVKIIRELEDLLK